MDDGDDSFGLLLLVIFFVVAFVVVMDEPHEPPLIRNAEPVKSGDALRFRLPDGSKKVKAVISKAGSERSMTLPTRPVQRTRSEEVIHHALLPIITPSGEYRVTVTAESAIETRIYRTDMITIQQATSRPIAFEYRAAHLHLSLPVTSEYAGRE